MQERVVEAIRDGEVVRMSEVQARMEDLFIIRRAEVIEARNNAEVARSIGQENVPSHRVLDLTNREQRVRVSLLDKWKRDGAEYKKNNVLKELVDNFHWYVIKVRKSRNLSRKQLADAIGCQEEQIKIIENGQLPQDNFFLINKLENFLKINLRKNRPVEQSVSVSDLQRARDVRTITQNSADSFRTHQKDQSSIKNLLGDDIEIID